LKSLKMSWRRMRRRPAKPTSADYERKRSALSVLTALEQDGTIDLYYLDETGFTLVPPIPYAWQLIGQTVEIPSQRSKRLNVLGFMTAQGNLESYVSEQSITSDVVANCIETFFHQVDRPTVIVMDQASIHLGQRVYECKEPWARRGVYLFELPAYSPELNRIEILWRFIKYQWLDNTAYQSWDTLVTQVERILTGFGQEFVINFT
ncbi:MAG: IS630 family transposase, partial [Cyanobacteria bacterium J06629_9]